MSKQYYVDVKKYYVDVKTKSTLLYFTIRNLNHKNAYYVDYVAYVDYFLILLENFEKYILDFYFLKKKVLQKLHKLHNLHRGIKPNIKYFTYFQHLHNLHRGINSNTKIIK